MQKIKKTSKISFYKSDKKKDNDYDIETKYPFLQRFVTETKTFRNEIKQTIKVNNFFLYKLIIKINNYILKTTIKSGLKIQIWKMLQL
jgi:hypothetical protein